MSTGIHTTLKNKRIEKGFSEAECAADTGLSIHAYDDVESYEDEFICALSLEQARRISAKLELNLEELLREYLKSSGRESIATNEFPVLPRHSLVRQARLSTGLSVSELADKIGYADITIHNMENASDYFEDLSIDVLLEIAELLGLDPARLIDRDFQT